MTLPEGSYDIPAYTPPIDYEEESMPTTELIDAMYDDDELYGDESYDCG